MAQWLQLKAGVDPFHLQPEMVLGIMVVSSVFYGYGFDTVITSLFEGQHSATTLHQRDGKCRAGDFRTKHIPRDILPVIITHVKGALGEHYDVVLEYFNQPNEHLHVEFHHKGAHV